MNKPDAHEKANRIRQSFRQYMNGVTAQSLRDKAGSYKIAWGISRGHLQDIAGEYEPDYNLAVELWQSVARECKLLATMLMPPERMTMELARQWIEQATTQELVEMLAYNLLQKLPFAITIAQECVASGDVLKQLCGFNIYGRLFINHRLANEESLTGQFLPPAVRALRSDNLSVRHAAMNSIVHFADLSAQNYNSAKEATRRGGFDFL